MITSTGNQQVKNVTALMKRAKERKKQRCFVAEGERMCMETPGELLKDLYVSESYLSDHERQLEGYPYTVVSDRVFSAMSDTRTPQGILAVAAMPEYREDDLLSDSGAHLLVLESIQDPGNLGTMIRTGEGAGVTGVIMNGTTADLFAPKTVRATMGSIFRVPYLIAEELEETVRGFGLRGVAFYGAHLEGTVEYDEPDYRRPCGFLIGNEGGGLTKELSACAKELVRIPMCGRVESLNAAVSAALFMYECSRQRRRDNK